MKYITCYMRNYKYELFSVAVSTGILEKLPQVQYSVSCFIHHWTEHLQIALELNELHRAHWHCSWAVVTPNALLIVLCSNMLWRKIRMFPQSQREIPLMKLSEMNIMYFCQSKSPKLNFWVWSTCIIQKKSFN